MKIQAPPSPALGVSQAPRPEPPVNDGDKHRPYGFHGRRHLQRGLKHVARDVRHAIHDELKELRKSDGDAEKVAAIRDATRTFQRNLQDVFRNADGGEQFDATSFLEEVQQAISELSSALREINGGEASPDNGKFAVVATAGTLLDAAG